MIKKLIDTNIFIDRFSNPLRHKEIFLLEGLVYLSAVVLMELRAGVHTTEARKAYHEIFNFFSNVNRILVPTVKDYEHAGEIVSKLQVEKGYEIKKSFSIVNDCLIAASARNIGAVLFTQNRKDFQSIKDIFDFKVVFV